MSNKRFIPCVRCIDSLSCGSWQECELGDPSCRIEDKQRNNTMKVDKQAADRIQELVSNIDRLERLAHSLQRKSSFQSKMEQPEKLILENYVEGGMDRLKFVVDTNMLLDMFEQQISQWQEELEQNFGLTYDDGELPEPIRL